MCIRDRDTGRLRTQYAAQHCTRASVVRMRVGLGEVVDRSGSGPSHKLSLCCCCGCCCGCWC
eukprot:4352720-Alexandrium_andersonii.AAC.1